MNLKRLIALCFVIVFAVSIAGCGDGKSPSVGENGITICVGPNPETIDPALNSAVDGAIIIQNAFSGLYTYGFDSAGEVALVPECAEKIVEPTALGDGRYQYVLTLREGLKWSDGKEIKASDFTYSWNRAASPDTGADYQYMFDVIDGYDEEAPKLNITADDAARTITVVTTSYCPYFDQLLAFPTYFPVREDMVKAHGDSWTTKPESYISNGPFKMSEWTVGDKIVMVKNEHYWDAENVKLDKVSFALSDDNDAIFANYENGTYDFIDDPLITQIGVLKNDPKRMDVDFFIKPNIGTYYLVFNVDVSFKPGIGTASSSAEAWQNWTTEQNAKARYAMGLLIDRSYIVDEVTQAGEQEAFGFVPTGMDHGTGTEFRSKAPKWWNPTSHEANVKEAIQMLKDLGYEYDEASGKFTNFPSFAYHYNDNVNNASIFTAVQDMWADYGISITSNVGTWDVYTTALQNGEHTVGRIGWIADYNDPINFLEIFISGGGNNYARIGKSGAIGGGAYFGENKNQKWSEVYDTVVAQIKTETDPAARAELMYKAESILKEHYLQIPIYYYTNTYMAKENLQGYIYNELGTLFLKGAYLEK